MEAASRSAALNQRQNDILGRGTALRALALQAPDVGFVRFHGLARAAHGRKLAVPHGFTDTVRQEPSRLVLNFQNAVKLMGANALLAGRQQVNGLQALVQRDMGTLEYSANPHRELLPAAVALPQTMPESALRVLATRL